MGRKTLFLVMNRRSPVWPGSDLPVRGGIKCADLASQVDRQPEFKRSTGVRLARRKFSPALGLRLERKFDGPYSSVSILSISFHCCASRARSIARFCGVAILRLALSRFS